MSVTYTEKAKQGAEGFSLLQQASTRLEEVLGPGAAQVTAEWDRAEDEKGRTVYTLRLSHWTGQVSATFAPDELHSPSHMRYRFHRLWGDLLQGAQQPPGRAFDELRVRGSEPQIARFVQEVDKALKNGWRRDTDAEARLARMVQRRGPDLCIFCPASSLRPAASLWLQAKWPGELYVPNIVPEGKRELTEAEYNAVLADFVANVARPAADSAGVTIEFIHPGSALEQHLSPEAVRRLQAFSASAKKGSLHASDYERWHAFVVQSHLEGAQLTPLVLEQWLAEQGWPQRQRQELASEYEAMRDVLAAYDEERAEKCLR